VAALKEVDRIAEDIVIVVREVKGDRVKIGIEALKLVRVLRGELLGKALTAKNAT